MQDITSTFVLQTLDSMLCPMSTFSICLWYLAPVYTGHDQSPAAPAQVYWSLHKSVVCLNFSYNHHCLKVYDGWSSGLVSWHDLSQSHLLNIITLCFVTEANYSLYYHCSGSGSVLFLTHFQLAFQHGKKYLVLDFVVVSILLFVPTANSFFSNACVKSRFISFTTIQ